MKTDVSIILLFFCSWATAGIVPVNSNSIIKDNIDYYMQTDKSVYTLGENVELLYRVTNVGGDAITFSFGDQVQYRFSVDKNDSFIWGVPKVGFPALSEFVLQPGEHKEYAEVWDMLDNQGITITPGLYNVTGSLNYLTVHERYVPVSVQIEIIPEPATIFLLGIGCFLLRIRK